MRSVFTEAAPQIVHDVRAGYPYFAVAADGVHHVVTAYTDGRLSADGAQLEDYPFPQPHRHPLPQTWLSWWQLALDDAFWYRQQRHPEGYRRDL
ncbi:hypothetical protein [Streptomyces maremycinicus]|uniref:hypothetical protein n=1 Tax=Streptomyces maremycinicus TaxID=1679753 RepID=UPI001F32D6CE|nr:hypothetical protein [Streptomyces sp. NBRC 110468]